MKRTALALALGALATGALADPGDAWYGTNRDNTVIIRPATPYTPYTYVERVPSDGATVYYDPPATTTAPVIVERAYVAQPDVVVIDAPPADGSPLFHVEPRKYGNVYNGGLFPRRGPNDFGS